MKAAQLRQSILQMAFTGDLTAEWRKGNGHDDDWAHVSIEQFLTSERRPMSTGPFGTMIKKSEHCLQGVPVLGIENIGEGKFIPGNKIFVTPQKAEDLKAFSLHTDDVIISRSGTVGELCLVPVCMNGSLLSTNLMRVTLDKDKMFPQFFIYLFQSKGIIVDQVKDLCRGSTRVFLNQTILKQIVFPLPPLAEQQRIVAKVDELMALCNELETTEKELDKLEVDFAEYLPKSILQAAVQGKLVPQNVHDEPASELLKRIQQEKARLAKEGKIKKEKPLPPITEDNVPDDLPDGWVWCRLGALIQVVSGTSYKKDYVQSSGIRILRGGNIQNHAIVFANDDVFLPVEFYDIEKTIKVDDIVIVASTGSNTVIGKPGFACTEVIGAQIGAFLRIIRPTAPNIADFLKVIFSGEFYREHIRTMVQGTNINNVKNEYITEFIIPFPPHSEQQRIVAKVDELMTLCDELKSARDVSVKPVASNVMPFPQPENGDEELLMVAQGEVSGKLSKELKQAQEDLFGDGANE